MKTPLSTRPSTPRLIAGAVLSPLVTPFVVYVGILVQAIISGGDVFSGHWSDLLDGLGNLSLFVLPVAYYCALGVALPLVFWLRARVSLPFWSAAIAGGAIGSAPMSLLQLITAIHKGKESYVALIGIGIVAGAAAGMVFWWVALRPTASRAAA